MRRTPTLRLFFIFFFLLSFFHSTNIYASGAKRPDLESDTPVVTDLPADTEPTVNEPDGPVTNDPGTSVPGGSSAYSHLDPDGMIPKSMLTKAINYFDQNKTKIKNKNYIVVIDFKKHSSKERFYLVDMQTGHVESYLMAHGRGSDEDHDGYATVFSNQSGSNASSVGYYLTAETYYGSNGFSLKLDGLSSTNSNARSRAIVIHGADYVTPGEKMGRSWGCPALEQRFNAEVIGLIKGGALIYAHNVY